MKAFIVLACVAFASAVPHGFHSGSSVSSRAEDGHGNYKFGYNEKHATGGTFRSEAGSAHGGVVGSYGLTDADGRQRVVNYVADGHGFRATIKTNEPGTAPQAAAATAIAAPKAGLAHVAPVVAHASYVAPVAAHLGGYGYAHGAYGHGLGYGHAVGHSYSTHVGHVAAPVAHYGHGYGLGGYGKVYG